ncbi:MAG: oxaloacetate decarboxylase, partial [Gammaproteobacteria bacterium]|nr:oxaloacetate decarboxylase [Gammaproteobacteria bacterium]
YDLINLLKKNMKIPIFLHSHATTGLSDATNIKAYEAGVDNLDASISSFSGTYGHTATESLISMIYQNDENPYDMKLLNEINVYFSNLREKYKNFEGSLKGIDTTMLYNQVPGGMLSNLERQLKDLDQEDKFKQLIDEIPNIRADLGYVPLVTPTSQIVGTQALMNILDGERYKNLTNEMIDLVTGKYGKIPGKISNKLLKIAEKKAGNQDCEAEKTIEIYKKDFKDICINNDLSNLYKNETDLLNYILFPDVAVNYYIKRKNASDNEVFDLQESLGFIIPD